MTEATRFKNTSLWGRDLRVAGLDFGANLAGTTCLAWLEAHQVKVTGSKKWQSADVWVWEQITELGITLIGIDAPLSLPPRYHSMGKGEPRGWQPEDYHFRPVDRQLGAMSPMFLGGLTARAIALADRCKARGMTVLEVYPRARAQDLGWETRGYKAKETRSVEAWALAQDWSLMFGLGPIVLERPPSSWHEVDAILALSTATRFQLGQARPHGHLDHGVIWI